MEPFLWIPNAQSVCRMRAVEQVVEPYLAEARVAQRVTSVRPAMGPPNRVSPLRGPASARSVARLPPADVGGDQTLITHSSRVLAFNNGLGTMGSLIPSSLKATRMRPTWIASTHAMPASISIISGDLRCAASDT
jgi:hypothetical protein